MAHGAAASSSTKWGLAMVLARQVSTSLWGVAPPCRAPGGDPEQVAPTSARKAVDVTLWTSYTLLCVLRSAFITRGSRGPANFAIALEKEAAPYKGGTLGHPQAHPGPTPHRKVVGMPLLHPQQPSGP